ncbi:hypothetical protein GWP57_02705 [Gammaproteobacteria bacterium]|jgi:hypothetical protein|nr:hypothetical protein [Gammaproteobacteria bacterium]
MGRSKPNGNNGRERQLLAQEAARIIVDQGIRDYRIAKVKAAERLGLSSRGALPRNAEIELAVSEHLQLFGRESHVDLLRTLREAALTAMELLGAHSPRLVGPVLSGTADSNSAVNLHVFSDSPENVALLLADLGIVYRPYERRLKSQRNRKAVADVYAGFRFQQHHVAIEATVFPVDGIRQAPISPIDGRPMRRADMNAVRELIKQA